MANQLITKRKLQQSTTGYGILLLLILVIGGYLGYQNYTEYQATKNALDSEQTQLNQLKGVADKAKTDFLALKKDMDLKNNDVNQSIEKILPSSEDFTNLARELDKYFRNTSITSNPMFLSDLHFNQSRLDKDADYGSLPFSMSISGNEDGFKQFLNYEENTGDLTDQSRLININSINLSFQEPAQSTSDNNTVTTGNQAVAALNQSKGINASLNLQAFFQKPLDATTK